MVQSRHKDLIKEANHSEEGYWRCLSPSSNVDSVTLKESQCLSQVWWICNVENRIDPEGCYEGFIKAGVSGVGPDGVGVNVMEGDSVTLNTSVKTNQKEKIRWYFGDTRIAEISGDLSKICTDVQCNKGTERFRGRLKLDHQTGSLTITNTRTTDSGDYTLKISNSNNSDIGKTFSVAFHGVSGVIPDRVSVFAMEEDSVTLHTDVKANQQNRIRWYFGDTRIAQINGDLSFICTDVECNKGTERFRDRLKLDNQTGSLTIMNITTNDSGDYQLKISSKKNNESIKSFIFAVHGVFAAERNEMKRKSVTEGESVTLDPCEVKNPDDLMTWYFNSMYMAKVNRDLSYICTDNQCTERFRDRLKLDHQTGSLTIMKTRTKDSGLYELQINSCRFSISRSFSVTVTGVTVTGGSDPRPASAAEICAAVIGSVIVGALLVAGVIYRYRKYTQDGKYYVQLTVQVEIMRFIV
ncbi:uncharacterized protein LOC113040598 [Carassius auratus]|uniref:Uncharacterized protein LOC113040598 n=1 Tax=Carassius auratus TaxID=7957 RepID=A0A6P6J3C3_CARAU|nr:uncharacterized protein LOC113040598 [Carassius auratus]